MGAQKDHETLCSLAYEFRNSPASRILEEKLQNRRSSALWLHIRHYIGRLGSWWKACKAVIYGATKFPSRLERFTLFPVISSRVSISLPAVPNVDFQDALERLFPNYNDDELQRVLQAFRHACGSDVDEEFLEKFTHKNFRPRLHAEVSMMEHCYQIDFVGNDRYIGCSKPSCYCCNLYTKSHPGLYLPRPCHGNTWINWCTPAHLDMHIALSRDENHEIMHRMVEEIRQDIESQLMGPKAKSRMFDSATGLSSSVVVSGV